MASTKQLHLYDTYERSLRPFKPMNPAEVTLYCCGPTVYDYAHIGNLRTYLFEDILVRTLKFNGYNVKHVVNITDVGHLVSDADEGEDKMEKGARRTNKTVWEIAEYYTQCFREDLRRLNICEPTVWCKATDHIPEQIETIRQIETNGYTYLTTDGVYFDTAKLHDYGYLARLDIEGLQAGARVDLGEKRNATDFALWKFSPTDSKRAMEWESPWGMGFPGWHIECSAMSAKYLGNYFDIHCGGEDHIPVHHTNEIAQTQACYGTHLANFWLHGFFLQLDSAKMSKSSGEFLRMQLLLDKGYDPLAYRFFCLSAHYRSKLNFNWESLDGATVALNRLRQQQFAWGAPSAADEGFVAQFTEQVNDDLNMPRALAVMWDLTRSDLPNSVKKATLLLFDAILGLGLADWKPTEIAIPAEIMALVDQRQYAKKEKRFKNADEIRAQVESLGYAIEDTPHGPRVKVKS